MRCPHCGSIVESGMDPQGNPVCPMCWNTGRISAPPAPPPQPMAWAPVGGAPAKPPGMAVAALVLGIATFVVFPLAIVLGPLALVFGIKAMRQLKRSPGTPGQGMAIAGVVLGGIGVLVGITIVMAAVVFVLVSNLGVSEPTFNFHVEADGAGGTLTLVSFTGYADWSDYELGGEARCTLPSGSVQAGDRIVCVTDGDVALIDSYSEETVYTTVV